MAGIWRATPGGGFPAYIREKNRELRTTWRDKEQRLF
jgi:hypothetical protein